MNNYLNKKINQTEIINKRKKIQSTKVNQTICKFNSAIIRLRNNLDLNYYKIKPNLNRFSPFKMHNNSNSK